MHVDKSDEAFGTVDLTNCDREPIHILGNVQDFGCLLAVSVDWIIAHASANCGALLGHEAEALIGMRFMDFFPAQSVHDLRTKLQLLTHQQGAARVYSFDLFEDGRLFDISIHNSDRLLVFEFEPREADAEKRDDAGLVQSLIARVQRHDTVEKMSQEAARSLRALTGLDRVMVYRFEEDDSGTVIAEATSPGMDSFLGLHYPASDIPRQARALYTRSLLRLIENVDGPVHPILPPKSPAGQPLDLSLAVTRAVSPIHLEYLRNMGVMASLSVSILRKGKLWGLFACHHNSPFHLDYERRSALELFAQLFSYELAQLETSRELLEVDRAREMHDQLMRQISNGDSLVDMFDRVAEQLDEVIPFDGIAVYSNGFYKSLGAAPTEDEFMGLARFLNTTPAAQVYATKNLAEFYPAADVFADRAAGLLAIPISRTPRDYLVLFRREILQTVDWAGNPQKPAEVGPNGLRLTPRKSFEIWQEVVRGTCAPWKPGEKRAADAVRVTLLEVVLKLSDENNATRQRAHEQQELLIAELNHRVRNILNLIRGLVSQGRGDARTIDAYSQILDARIHALARAHDQLTEKEWGWVSLRTLVENEVNAFLSGKCTRVRIEGDDIDLTPQAFTTMALVVHELVTNSAKYGALSDSSGEVLIGILLRRDGSARIRWRERNGPPVKAPERKGFGTTIIEHSIPFELGGTAEVHYRLTGLEAEFALPSNHVARAVLPTAAQVQAEKKKAVATVSLSGAALVLEDNMIIAMDGADMLTDLGAEAVHTASRCADALRLLEAEPIRFALLDVNLGDESSLPVAEDCARRGIPTILATGYGASGDLVKEFPEGLVIIRKPYTLEHVRQALADLEGSDPES